MRRLTAGGLVVLAVVLAGCTAVALAVMPLVLGAVTVTEVVIATIGVYNLILISWVRPSAGRFTGWVLTASVTLACLAIVSTKALAGGPCVLLMLGWTWLLRCALLHRNLQSVLGDGVLLAGGVAAAIWAFQTGAGLAVSLWSFFLVQALLPWICGTTDGENPAQAQRRFDQARQRADQALQRIYRRPAR